MEIKGADRYNPEQLKKLEEDVAAQADSRVAYNPDVNFTVLRIYQFYPTYANAGVVQKILLMVRPSPPLPRACLVYVLLFQGDGWLNEHQMLFTYSPALLFFLCFTSNHVWFCKPTIPPLPHLRLSHTQRRRLTTKKTTSPPPPPPLREPSLPPLLMFPCRRV